MLVFRYGQRLNDNKLLVIDPRGEVAYSYQKTLSSYPTWQPDGLLHVVDTPNGRLSTAICSDMTALRTSARRQNKAPTSCWCRPLAGS